MDQWDDSEALRNVASVFDESWTKGFQTTDPIAPVRAYVRMNSANLNQRVVNMLQRLVSAVLSDDELDHLIVRDAGARIYFPGVGITPSGWLLGSLAAAEEELAIRHETHQTD